MLQTEGALMDLTVNNGSVALVLMGTFLLYYFIFLSKCQNFVTDHCKHLCFSFSPTLVSWPAFESINDRTAATVIFLRIDDKM